MASLQTFHQHTLNQFQQIVEHEQAHISAAAQAIASSIINENDFLTFGSGHSELVAREAMWRAGGLGCAMTIIDPSGGDVERLEGAASLIFGHYVLREGSTIIIISNSGINPVPIEAAQLCKNVGLTVVAITSHQHSEDVSARHSSGQKLYDIADITIDTHTPRGDSAISMTGNDLKVGATSTLAGVFIMQSIIVEAAQAMQSQGYEPPVVVSANVPEGDAHNSHIKNRYFQRLSRYVVDTADVK
ncbi:MAG: sugar isomerase domain-containing protein [Chloroflexota bacterium]